MITGGNAESEGGGIRVGNNAILVAGNSDIRNNICIDEGAGIYNMGNLLLLNSGVAKNQKQGINNTGSTILINSTIYDNLKIGRAHV